MITKLGLYSALISNPGFKGDGTYDFDVTDSYWAQPFLFRSDEDAVAGLTKAASGADHVKLHSIYRVGMFDPFSGKISDIKRKEVYTYETSVDETQ